MAEAASIRSDLHSGRSVIPHGPRAGIRILGPAGRSRWLRGGRSGRLALARVEREAGGVAPLVILGQAAQEVPEGMRASCGILPGRPPEIERAGRELVPGPRPVGRVDGP